MNPARSRPPNQLELRKPRESGIARIYVTGAVPAVVAAAIAEDFELADTPEGADGILSLLTTTVDSALLDRAGPQLAVVANYAVGVNNIDLEAARGRGIVVANTPDVLTRPTAELAVTLMLTLLRRVAEGDRLIRDRGEWGFSLEFMLGESLDGKLVAVVGPGRIGRETARLVEAFGARTSFAGRRDPLHELLAVADIVSLHCPLTAETHHLIDADALRAMNPSAVLVNTARGPIVDERALVEALREGWIAGAALDVYEDEPNVSTELLELENVVLSPHLGSATRPTREAMGILAVEALRAVLLRGETPPNVVEL
jgi:glyoxylate reductase